MNIFKRIFETIVEKIFKSKEQRIKEAEFVLNNEGTKAISVFIANLFEKGNGAYVWVKKNRLGLYPVVHEDTVSLCYMQGGDAKTLAGCMPKDAEVARYTFTEMYRWYGLDEDCGYKALYGRTQYNALEGKISSEINKLPHLKYANGYVVKMFQ